MKYIEAINEYIPNDKGLSIFLAGGITNCPDWQKKLVELLKDTKLVIFNPRRKNFPIHDPNASLQQIDWEYRHFKKADLISFWFSRGSINPIVLFELGKWCHGSLGKKIFIGIDKPYERKQDVEIQMKLERPDITIVYNLRELASQIIDSIPRLSKIIKGY